MSYQDLSKFSVPAHFRGRSKIVVQLWWMIQSSAFSWSPQVLYGWRRFLLRCFGAKIGKNVLIRSTVKVTYPWNLSVGDNTWIGDDTVLYNLGKISIGQNVAIAHKVYLNTGGHDYKVESFPIFSEEVVIEDECWITNDVYVAPGVRIGRGCVLGARSTVLQNMPSGKVCVGTPARPIKDRI
ncbi:WcaF family extracellular polysaccharide biosynthesis acetyltransferase [Dyadobacter chenhuakuii]|uniref:WcaF family extracellular polysaccharide biosynthesis acetyltransferase n=1 Tax=Dyadobacter chenhuakuii TaxID=2909339 RepID=A0A9X1QKV0_9BACT|nr:WcaF family extracellular polysaccharide biosynthesis acetyltransferase [Dyadobacter chenhuakuii]MCF2501514.1 WcaF family extracellular polysaccharide biosynthesis acetyltransferase [Dyadobacter chenhuakuii]